MNKRKTDSPRKRMREVEFRAAKSHRSPTMRIMKDNLDSLPEAQWETAARAALSIEDMKEAYFNGEKVKLPDGWIDYQARAMRRLFDHFNLDADDPWSWRMLVTYFAYIFFWKGPPKKPGRPIEWTDDRETELAAMVAMLPGSSADLARRLANDKKSPFVAKSIDKSSGRGLRSRIAKVRKKGVPKAGT